VLPLNNIRFRVEFKGTADLYGPLMPGTEAGAAAPLDAHLVSGVAASADRVRLATLVEGEA